MTYAPPLIHQPPPSFVKEKVPAPHLHTTSPPWLSDLQACFQTIPNYIPPSPPQEKNTLPSFLLKEKTILLHLPPCYVQAAATMETKDT